MQYFIRETPGQLSSNKESFFRPWVREVLLHNRYKGNQMHQERFPAKEDIPCGGEIHQCQIEIAPTYCISFYPDIIFIVRIIKFG
jgi:hypothetical protein